MKKIKIKQVARIEGHAGFMAKLEAGRVSEAIVETQVGARLIEGLVMGRDFRDPPIITARICGICPVVHNLTSMAAIEDALGVDPTDQTKKLREIMALAQIVQSHSLHLVMLSYPDFIGLKSDIDLIQKYEKEVGKYIKVKDFSNRVIDLIGGRAIHPLTPMVGGMTRLPDEEEMKGLIGEIDGITKLAEDLAKIMLSLDLPDFSRETEFVALGDTEDYPFFKGRVVSTKGIKVEPVEFLQIMSEVEKKGMLVKRGQHDGEPYMCGAVSRLNLNADKLSGRAVKLLKDSGLKLPTTNTFANLFGQAIELVHCLEVIKARLVAVMDEGLSEQNVEYEYQPGVGTAAMEAPRGLLVHQYELGEDKKIAQAIMVTPTSQFLANLEADLKMYLEQLGKVDGETKDFEIRKMIRAYDPCITCATH